MNLLKAAAFVGYWDLQSAKVLSLHLERAMGKQNKTQVPGRTEHTFHLQWFELQQYCDCQSKLHVPGLVLKNEKQDVQKDLENWKPS